jgi:hypothetical protein
MGMIPLLLPFRSGEIPECPCHYTCPCHDRWNKRVWWITLSAILGTLMAVGILASYLGWTIDRDHPDPYNPCAYCDTYVHYLEHQWAGFADHMRHLW